MPDDRFQAALQLFLVDEPVAQSRRIVVALSEPAVVQNEGIHAQLRRRVDDGTQLFVIEIKVRSLPVVDDDRAARIDTFRVDDIFTEKVVIRARHAACSRRGIAQRRLRRCEYFPAL